MDFKSFSEKAIRNAILNKIDPQKKTRTGKHWKGYIYIDSKLITKVKIPNSHTRLFPPSKAKFLATDLKLDEEKYNDLMDCPLTGEKYYNLLKEKLNSK